MKLIVLPFAALFLVGCAGNSQSTFTPNKQNSTSARTSTSLQLPPDLVNSSNESIQNNQGIVEAVVIPEVVGVTVMQEGDKKWLEIDAPAEQVWPKLVGHWIGLGANLVINDPQIGIMETDWVKEGESEGEKEKKNFLIGLLEKVGTAEISLDKYTTRLERSDGKTLVYISHRGSKKIQIGQSTIATNPTWEWVETDENPDKVSIALQSIRYTLDPENT